MSSLRPRDSSAGKSSSPRRTDRNPESIDVNSKGGSEGMASGLVPGTAPHKEDETEAEDDIDCGRLITSKSLATMLTTASMYAGVSQLDDDAIESSDLDEPIPYVPYEGDAESVMSESTVGVDTVRDTDFSEQINPEIDGLVALRKKQQHTLSKFELSVVRKRCSQLSLAGSSSGSTRRNSFTLDNNETTRAVKLCEKLKTTFDLSDDDEFVNDYPCWLLHEVFLQGHIYITSRYLLYFAFLPKRDSTVTMSGALSIRSSTTMRFSVRRWAVLKGNYFRLYANSTERYFPSLNIDLRFLLKVELSNPNLEENKPTVFKLITEARTHYFQADSLDNARSWVTDLRKHIFTAKNSGGHVTIKVPLENILDLSIETLFEASQTLKLKVLESEESYAIDDYYFMFFNNGDQVLDSIRQSMKALGIELTDSDSSESDSDVSGSETNGRSTHRKSKLSRSLSVLTPIPRGIGSIYKPIKSSASGIIGAIKKPQKSATRPFSSVVETVVPNDNDSELKQDDAGDAPKDPEEPSTKPSNWSAKSLVQGFLSTTSSISQSMLFASPMHYNNQLFIERGEEDPYFVTNKEEREVAQSRFRKHFSLPDSEELLASYFCHFQKNIPVYGKVYLGTTCICYRSLFPGTNTTMILPYSDIENVYNLKGFRFGYSGLVIVIRAHEELFFEFGSNESRDDCDLFLLKQLDFTKSHKNAHSKQKRIRNDSIKLAESVQLADARLRYFETRIESDIGREVPIILEENQYSTSEIRSKRRYKFVLLTIGSRGDVQPYISLAKGLLAENHKVKIVTHEEFKPWVESYGIEFATIAGNPAELMSLMVTHKSLSVGFLKEAKEKFTGWIGELLQSSWDACQDADVLIESPSAMAGIHIAEKLQIPYFRAFTMPWTRTRAYPHAFVVPEQKRGGSYNYLTHIIFENVFWKGISGEVNKWREQVLMLPKTNLERLEQNKVPFLYNVSPTVFPPSMDFPHWVKVVGYWFLDEGEADSYDPPKPLLEFMEKAKTDGKKLVYIGFGSIVVSDPKQLTEAVIDAVLSADVRCILNKGWSDRLGKQAGVEVELPEEIYNSGNVPHDWLFGKIDSSVHHGGSGTTGATLRAGIPTIIKPFFGDQFFYANRVEDIGVGIGLRKLNSKSLSKAIKEVTTNTRIIEKAKEIGKQIQSENGVSAAIRCLYQEMEYAKKLSKSKQKYWDNQSEDISDDSVSGSWFEV
ncbi:Sterol 3-beta-glucosyltransferase [Komagataella kurtzmanii]|nr:Sterol 3-beta-glucosyltransferase [Komagataella kurtzmanii]